MDHVYREARQTNMERVPLNNLTWECPSKQMCAFCHAVFFWDLGSIPTVQAMNEIPTAGWLLRHFRVNRIWREFLLVPMDCRAQLKQQPAKRGSPSVMYPRQHSPLKPGSWSVAATSKQKKQPLQLVERSGLSGQPTCEACVYINICFLF